MGWAYGHNNEGREVGYSVSSLCDEGGCPAQIDRGLSYVCGGMHDGDEHGCGGYFCGEHLRYCKRDWDDDDEEGVQVCDRCEIQYENKGLEDNAV